MAKRPPLPGPPLAPPSGEAIAPASSALYSAGIRAYGMALQVVSLWHPQAKAWRQGRAGGMAAIAERLSAVPVPRIWMHCASLGEFEQGRPVLEALREAHPDYGIVVSFFSPSGYAVRSDWPVADAVVYLPLDTPENARAFIACLQPAIALWVRYEFWLNHLHAAAAFGTRIYLIAARFDAGQRFFGHASLPWTRWFQDGLRCFQHIFCQDAASLARLEELGLPRVGLASDTRFDRVAEVAEGAAQQTLAPALRAFCQDAPLLVAGSSWPADEKHLIPFLVEQVLPAGWRVLMAPHHVDGDRVAALCRHLPDHACRWSEHESGSLPEHCRILVMDQIGLLGAIYGLGKAAYVGGAFGTGLHNILEPAAFALPLAFGPQYQGFPEAEALIQSGAAHSVSNSKGLSHWFGVLQDAGGSAGLSAEGRKMGDAAAAYVAVKRGGTAVIVAQILADERAGS